MKLKDGLLLNQVGEDYVVVASNTDIFKGMLKLNESGALIFKHMQNDTSLEEIVDLLLKEYDVDREVVTQDVAAYIDTFKSVGLIEE